MDFAFSADHRVKLKESEKRNKYLDFARELIKFCRKKMMVMPTVIGALGLVKGLEELEIRKQVETIQTMALLRSARILRRVPDIWGD